MKDINVNDEVWAVTKDYDVVLLKVDKVDAFVAWQCSKWAYKSNCFAKEDTAIKHKDKLINMEINSCKEKIKMLENKLEKVSVKK